MGVQPVPLSETKMLEVQQCWLSKYLGKKCPVTRLQFFWEAFTRDLVPHVAGDSARNAYRATSSSEFQVISAFPGGPGYTCSGKRMPNLEGKNIDAIVTPLDLSWTMSFNHEQYGPHFTKVEWVLGGVVESDL